MVDFMPGSLPQSTEVVNSFSWKMKCEHGLHPTQDSVELFEYFIRTYTDLGELVLDSCMGSETTAVACIQSGRNFSGFEVDGSCYQTAINRIK